MTSSWTEVQSEDSEPNLMSALGQKQTYAVQKAMSALFPKRPGKRTFILSGEPYRQAQPIESEFPNLAKTLKHAEF